uniref:Uncharacterized protein n=1 Tax=Anguilla anguilla TaxID=7936 RepID=A0A0E9QLJ3_ANGAN
MRTHAHPCTRTHFSLSKNLSGIFLKYANI